MDEVERELRDALVYQIYQKRSGAPTQKPINIHVNPLKCASNVHINKNFVHDKIHYNPKFLIQKSERIHVNPNYVNHIHVNKNFIIKEPDKIEKLKQVEQPIKIQTKYTIIRKNQESPIFKKIGLNNRKIIRNTLLKSKIYKKRSYKTIKNYLKIDRRQKDESVFKSIGARKLIRKSVLQTHIDKRRILKKNIIRKYYENRKFRKKQLRLKNSKRQTLQKNQKKKLKKNNQLCLFYNRYGRCKGNSKGICNKVHDPKYIAICKKLLQGKCTDENCLLSHDVRPEKMPTCHHYLSGVCKQPDCPFLHIKVNSKAPICPLFLRGFCADVYNCAKRHEYICPIYAEKGACLRGKSCPYPHPKKTKPIPEPESHPQSNEKVSNPLFILDDEPDELSISKNDIRPTPCFKRYFADKVQDS